MKHCIARPLCSNGALPSSMPSQRDNAVADLSDEENGTDIPCAPGYQVVAVTATKEQPASVGGTMEIQNSSLIPYKDEGHWHHEICERAFACGGDCLMAWFCPIFPIAQIAERLKYMGVYNLSFSNVLLMVVLWMVMDIILALITGSASGTLWILLAILCCQMRGIVRAMLGIPGTAGGDCLHSFFCSPCAIIQMVGSLWVAPQEVPGCSFNYDTAYLP